MSSLCNFKGKCLIRTARRFCPQGILCCVCVLIRLCDMNHSNTVVGYYGYWWSKCNRILLQYIQWSNKTINSVCYHVCGYVYTPVSNIYAGWSSSPGNTPVPSIHRMWRTIINQSHSHYFPPCGCRADTDSGTAWRRYHNGLRGRDTRTWQDDKQKKTRYYSAHVQIQPSTVCLKFLSSSIYKWHPDNNTQAFSSLSHKLHSSLLIIHWDIEFLSPFHSSVSFPLLFALCHFLLRVDLIN